MSTYNIAQVFEMEEDFVDLMFECGTNQKKIDQIIADGFVTTKDLVIHHENNTETFLKYLKLLNKMFSQHPDLALKLYFPYRSLADW